MGVRRPAWPLGPIRPRMASWCSTLAPLKRLGGTRFAGFTFSGLTGFTFLGFAFSGFAGFTFLGFTFLGFAFLGFAGRTLIRSTLSVAEAK